MVEWQKWADRQPQVGEKVVIVCNDGCSSSLALMTDNGPLDGECGEEFYKGFLDGAIWAALPDDYPIAFMEYHDDY